MLAGCRIRLSALVGCLTLSCLLAPGGCEGLDRFRGAGFSGEDATWGETLRPQDQQAGERFFFNEKSQQIERSLGL